MMGRLVKFYIKEIAGRLCLLLGGVYLVKLSCRKKGGFLVLNYHSFSSYNNYRIRRGDLLETGFQRNFERQLIWLGKRFDFATPEEFFSGKRAGITCFITFDDGYRDNFSLAYPVLKKHGLTAAFFIVTAYPDTESWLLHDKIRYLVQTKKFDEVLAERALRELNQGSKLDESFYQKVESYGETFPRKRLMMNWNEIRKLHSDGFYIGSHTHNHLPLVFLSDRDRENEMTSAMKLLIDQLGSAVDYFAYPNGLYDRNCLSLMRFHEIEYAFTTRPGYNRASDSPLEIKRIGVNPSDSIGVLLLKLILNIGK